MANALKGEVTVEFEGRPATLVLDMNALCEFEEVTGKAGLEWLVGDIEQQNW